MGEKRLKKVGWANSFDESEIPKIIQDYNHYLKNKFDEVLELSVEQYLGRKFDCSIDAERIELQIIQETNDTNVVIDGNLIGIIKTIIAHNGDDFIKNKMSIAITFTPFFYDMGNYKDYICTSK